MKSNEGLSPYYNSGKNAEFLGRAEIQKFNPVDYVNAPNPLTAARDYLKNIYGDWAVRIFDNVIDENYRGRKITDELLPEIGKRVAERNSLAKDELANVCFELTRIKNARIGNGNAIEGYLESMSYG